MVQSKLLFFLFPYVLRNFCLGFLAEAICAALFRESLIGLSGIVQNLIVIKCEFRSPVDEIPFPDIQALVFLRLSLLGSWLECVLEFMGCMGEVAKH